MCSRKILPVGTVEGKKRRCGLQKVAFKRRSLPPLIRPVRFAAPCRRFVWRCLTGFTPTFSPGNYTRPGLTQCTCVSHAAPVRSRKCSDSFMLPRLCAEPLDGEEYLDISGITRTQAGRYQCKASNDVASPDVKYVNVIVNYAPFIKDTKSSDPQVGRMGVLQCEASAIPKPEFKWYRDDKRSRCEAVMGARYVALCSYSAPVSRAACLYELWLSPIFTSTCWRLAPGLSAGDWHQVFLLETGTRSFCWRLAPGLSAGDWHQVFLLETGTRSFCWGLAPGLSAGDWHQVFLLEIGTRSFCWRLAPGLSAGDWHQVFLLEIGTRSFCWRLAPGLSAGDWHQVFLLETGTRLSNGQGISIQMMGSRTLLLVSNVTEEDYGNYTCVATNRLGIHNASVFLYRPGTANNMSGAVAVSQSLWLLLGSLTCLLLKC
ncbi:hypothetical protein ACEWY4_007943 [Coilia grayii]|uniref:Ig-like domain-containing protein n=1 Tax=Coilia grayii TaxID=363190 RepID=A0ABD1K9J4_9TELE